MPLWLCLTPPLVAQNMNASHVAENTELLGLLRDNIKNICAGCAQALPYLSSPGLSSCRLQRTGLLRHAPSTALLTTR